MSGWPNLCSCSQGRVCWRSSEKVLVLAASYEGLMVYLDQLG